MIKIELKVIINEVTMKIDREIEPDNIQIELAQIADLIKQALPSTTHSDDNTLS
jgi:hypothetical protein